MATVNELYGFLESAIPAELACDWDNDGRMVVPSSEKKVERVLITLDISADAVEYAVSGGFDCIISHHPLIFTPLKSVDGSGALGKKLCRLIKNDIAAFSFHTRLDKVSGGVNDALADKLMLKNITEFSDVGRMGETEEISLELFAKKIKEVCGSDRVVCVDGGGLVNRVALVGGSGKGYLEEALACGCDTFITGEMAFNYEHDAKEMGINLICAGHYFTEAVVGERLEMLVKAFDHQIVTEFFVSNPAFAI